jgi:hypothetical protein
MKDWIEKLSARALSDGGFADRPGGGHRPDATAWAVIAITASGEREDLANTARMRLQREQMKDGRVCVIPDYPKAYWPTALAIMAWHGSPKYLDSQSRALQFLLSTSGKHWKKRRHSIIGHDPAIKGWPWIENTHSWVEPTSLALLSLEVAGQHQHKRSCEARRMLLDRQLEGGGWNYGNTTVFGQILRPMPESTGMALSVLAERVPREKVTSSIAYLQEQVNRLLTPLSLSWSLLGLSTWDKRPENAEDLIFQSLSRQAVYGLYDTAQLSLLILALLGKKGLLNLIL